MGKEYKYSGKVDWSRAVLWFAVGLLCSGLIGAIYGKVSLIIPYGRFNIFDILHLGITVFVLVVVLVFIVKKSHAHSRFLAIVMTIIMCFFAWYCGWCMLLSDETGVGFFKLFTDMPAVFDAIVHRANTVEILMRFTRSRRSVEQIGSLAPVLYLVEFLVFFYPVFRVVKMKWFFCEKCSRNMELRTMYVSDINLVKQNLADIKSGDISFLDGYIPLFKTEQLHKVYKAYAFNFYFCESCKSTILNLERISPAKGNSDGIAMGDSEDIIKGIHLNSKSVAIVSSLLELSKLPKNRSYRR